MDYNTKKLSSKEFQKKENYIISKVEIKPLEESIEKKNQEKSNIENIFQNNNEEKIKNRSQKIKKKGEKKNYLEKKDIKKEKQKIKQEIKKKSLEKQNYNYM